MLKTGDKIRYNFPDPADKKAPWFEGIIKFVGETFIIAESENGVSMKINYANYRNIEIYEAEKAA